MRLAYRTVVRKRTELLFFVFALAYAVIALRLTYLQFWQADRYEEFGQKIRDRRLEIPAQRGVIYDRLGRVLAINVRAASVYANPKRIKNPDHVSFQLASMMSSEPDLVARKLNLDKKFVWVRRGATDEVGTQIEKAGFDGIGVIKEQRRTYPASGLAAHIIGFTNVDGKGIEGVEKVADDLLKGSNGFVIGEVDPNGRVIPETRRRVVKPHDGRDVILTIDADIQHVTEAALDETFVKNKAVGATAVVLDPRTGEILALANRPTFDPNKRVVVTADNWRNRGITDVYEPGSTLKMVTAAAALEEGIVDFNDVYTTCKGSVAIGRRRVRCVLHHPYEGGHQGVDVTKMITFSCNIGASALGMKLGPDRLYKYEKAFGLLSAPGLDLVPDRKNYLDSPSVWPQIRTANVAFGQGIAITPLQLACAYGAIANHGVLMQPTIFKEIRNKDGSSYKVWKPKVVRRVVSESTADLVTKSLVNCVVNGTGKTAAVEGYMVAGKTGSAQKVRTDGRGYSGFIASFIGFLPASNPRLVILVVVDEPKGSHWGATVAAPAFQKIGTSAMWYLRVPRDAPQARPGVQVAKRVALAETSRTPRTLKTSVRAKG